ncbi:sodium:proton antiporter [Weissella diestrammenae]|uniref:Sodium:proton antiporter n=1 Tax=Weissella diestrammenae TaxID=1162633 RepID=A0A7G9T414_9LACO|nr:sodium:proton antiporter [Weissella diestrammenae]MCM0583037.1 sodium:proton antiporter [Weissella diestrammenae]QNN74839.1 sodium:proton antiporter [Weissella diestrammenae]
MDTLEVIIALVGLVLIGNMLSHFIKSIPVSLIQIGLGLLVAISFNVEIKLETSWFLLLFIAPLLYSDAWRFPKRELWALRGPIFGNAILLVVITTVLGGLIIYLIVPELSLPVAFAIAAILSPTDPVAVQAIAKDAKLPANVLHLVAGESLINDASGLVAFKFAIAATVAGTFSLLHATGEFIYMSLVGALVGALIISIFNAATDFLAEKGAHDVVFSVSVQLFSPFIIYLTAEHFHASGVIAVVVAAIIANLQTKTDVNYTGELHLTGIQTWNILGYLLDGTIFVLLGIEIPVAMQNFAGETGKLSLMMVTLYAFATWLTVFGIRVLWTYFTQFVRRRTHHDEVLSWRIAIVSGLTGVRGAVTMAGVLSVPLFIADGKTPFPERGLMLFISSAVIIISLLAAVIFLPLLAEKPVKQKGTAAPVAKHMTEARAHIYVLQSAVREIEQHRRENNQTVAYDIMLRYQMQIRQIQLENMSIDKLNPMLASEVTIRRIALTAERDSLRQLLVDEKISEFVYTSEVRRIDRLMNDLERMHQRPSQKGSMRCLKGWFLRGIRAVRVWLTDEENDKVRAEYMIAQSEAAKAAITAISEFTSRSDDQVKKIDQQIAHNLVISYRNRIEKAKWVKREFTDVQTEAIKMALEMIGLTAQREAVQHLFEAHFISADTGMKLRQGINFTEAGLLTKEAH